jgi:hypothetical protein
MNQVVTPLVNFRENIHGSFHYRNDATLELIDVIAGNTSAQSPAALSLNSLFHREYGSIYDAEDSRIKSREFIFAYRRFGGVIWGV